MDKKRHLGIDRSNGSGGNRFDYRELISKLLHEEPEMVAVKKSASCGPSQTMIVMKGQTPGITQGVIMPVIKWELPEIK